MTTAATISSQSKTAPSTNWRDYFAMTKPTITLLVVVTAIPGLLMEVSAVPSATLFVATLIGAALSSASAAVYNQVVEYESDKYMKRTAGRSVASGRVPRIKAALFGAILGILGLVILYKYATPLAAVVAFAGHIYYVVIYTMLLKKRTPQNIVIGGGAGAVGPLIGVAAATNSLPVSAWLLFVLIFLWTPPHFWALALKYQKDYASAGIPMYPVVYGDHRTRWAMFLYTLSLIPVVLFLSFANGVGLISIIVMWSLTLKFAWDAWKLYSSGTNKRAMPLFHFSCIYTFAIYLAISVERLMILL
jgi:protoheme IX farnesyltransferase